MADREKKPCPFCGGEANGPFVEIGEWAVDCDECGIDGPWRDTPEEAIAAWNRRSHPEGESVRGWVLPMTGTGQEGSHAFFRHREPKMGDEWKPATLIVHTPTTGDDDGTR